VPQDTSAASIFLVAKLGAHPCPPRDVCNVYAYLLSTSSPLFGGSSPDSPPNDPLSYYLSETEYSNMHGRILKLEARILYSLSFDTHVALPHSLAVTYLQALDFLERPKKEIAQRVIEYLNTTLLSPQLLYLTHQPNALVVAAIYNAARDIGAKMPECAWWEVFDVDREELGFLVVGMRSLEGWIRKQREILPQLGKETITRKIIEVEMRKRGLRIGNGSATEDEVSEEDAMMRKLDAKMQPMEE
jgi:cyclin L